MAESPSPELTPELTAVIDTPTVPLTAPDGAAVVANVVKIPEAITRPTSSLGVAAGHAFPPPLHRQISNVTATSVSRASSCESILAGTHLDWRMRASQSQLHLLLTGATKAASPDNEGPQSSSDASAHVMESRDLGVGPQLELGDVQAQTLADVVTRAVHSQLQMYTRYT